MSIVVAATVVATVIALRRQWQRLDRGLDMSEDHVAGVGGNSRRALFVGAGAIGAAVVLAACGSADPTGRGGATGQPTTTTAGPAGEPVSVGSTGDIPVGGGVIFASQGVVVTQPTAGEFKAFDSVCTHQQCPLAGVDGGTINCGCHGSAFSIKDGSVRNGPATRSLPTKEIKVEGERILLA